jgi:autotransporter-associated beta strand protein
MGPSGEITLGNNVNGNYLVQAGAGILLLQGSNTLAGGLVAASGTIWARAENCLSANTIVSGGTLQLFFGFDFTGTAMTLSGGTLHVNAGIPTYEGVVSLATDSSIQLDGAGDSLTLPNPAGLQGGSHNLNVLGAGTLVLGGTNNSWASVTVNGTLAFNSSANLIVAGPISGIGGVSQRGSGSIIFTGDLSSLTGASTVSAGTLGGAITDGGSLDVAAGATLAPGTPSAIGTMTINGALTLGGNLLVKLNKSLVQSNDMVAVPGGVSNTGNGVVTVKNLGPALAVGNQFTLFSSAVSGGDTLSVTGGSATWLNNLATDGSITVQTVSTIAGYSTNISYHVSGGSMTISWPATHLGWILQSQTNSLSTGLSTNWVNVAGTAAVTSTNIPMSATVPTAFYRLAHP